MKTNNPITVDGITYSDLSANLSASTRFNKNGESIVDISLRLTPFKRYDDGTIKKLVGHDRTVFIADIGTTGDEESQILFGSIYKLVEDYVLEKNI